MFGGFLMFSEFHHFSPFVPACFCKFYQVGIKGKHPHLYVYTWRCGRGWNRERLGKLSRLAECARPRASLRISRPKKHHFELTRKRFSTLPTRFLPLKGEAIDDDWGGFGFVGIKSITLRRDQFSRGWVVNYITLHCYGFMDM
jgi:hypothetical protein